MRYPLFLVIGFNLAFGIALTLMPLVMLAVYTGNFQERMIRLIKGFVEANPSPLSTTGSFGSFIHHATRTMCLPAWYNARFPASMPPGLVDIIFLFYACLDLYPNFNESLKEDPFGGESKFSLILPPTTFIFTRRPSFTVEKRHE